MDDFSVGNPRRGFPYAKHKILKVTAFFLFYLKLVRNIGKEIIHSLSVLRT